MKYWNYVMLSVGLALIFEMAGLPIAKNILDFWGIDIVNGSFSLEGSDLYGKIFLAAGILAATTVGGIIVGTLTRSSPENYLILPFITTGGIVFVTVWTSIVTEAFKLDTTWIAYTTLMIAAILGTGFVIASYEHFRGTD